LGRVARARSCAANQHGGFPSLARRCRAQPADPERSTLLWTRTLAGPKSVSSLGRGGRCKSTEADGVEVVLFPSLLPPQQALPGGPGRTEERTRADDPGGCGPEPERLVMATVRAGATRGSRMLGRLQVQVARTSYRPLMLSGAPETQRGARRTWYSLTKPGLRAFGPVKKTNARGSCGTWAANQSKRRHAVGRELGQWHVWPFPWSHSAARPCETQPRRWCCCALQQMPRHCFQALGQPFECPVCSCQKIRHQKTGGVGQS